MVILTMTITIIIYDKTDISPYKNICTCAQSSADSRCFWGHIPIVAAWAESLCMYPGITQGIQKVWGQNKGLVCYSEIVQGCPKQEISETLAWCFGPWLMLEWGHCRCAALGLA